MTCTSSTLAIKWNVRRIGTWKHHGTRVRIRSRFRSCASRSWINARRRKSWISSTSIASRISCSSNPIIRIWNSNVFSSDQPMHDFQPSPSSLSLEQQQQYRNLLDRHGLSCSMWERQRKHCLKLIMITTDFSCDRLIEPLHLRIFLPFHQSMNLMRFCHVIKLLRKFFRMNIVSHWSYRPYVLLWLLSVNKECLTREFAWGLHEVVVCVLWKACLHPLWGEVRSLCFVAREIVLLYWSFPVLILVNCNPALVSWDYEECSPFTH